VHYVRSRGSNIRKDPDLALARVAARQHGLVTSAQLARAGLTRAAISNRVAAGRLHPLYRGVYGLGHRKLSQEGGWLAAVLASGDGAALSHLSAATLWQISRVRTAGADVVVPRQRRARPGIRARWSRHLDPRDVTKRNGIPVTTVARTLVDLTDVLTAEQLANVIHEAAFHKRFNLRAIHAAMARANGRRLNVLRAALKGRAAGSAGTKSGLEDRFLALIRRAGLPEPLPNVHVEAAGSRIEVDAYWPELRLCVEIDGPGHDRPRTQEEDNARDRALKAAGLRILRFTGDDIDHRPTTTTAALDRACTTQRDGPTAAQARQALSQNATSCSTDVRNAACIAA
jgi:Transcriptional regulator, AbiEi antitoxin/Protein of unknown function (DUF559)